MIRLIRRSAFTLLALVRAGSWKTIPVVRGYTRLSRQTHLGRNVHFNGMIVYGAGKVAIGDNFHSGPGCKILTESHNAEGTRIPYDQTKKLYSIQIGNNVWLGMDVTVIGNVTIGDGAIVQVGSVVVSDVPSCAIVGGHPARVFAWRDRAKYERLVADGKVH